MSIFLLLLTAVLSYLIGAIPTAFIFGKVFRGIDIREHGSKNIGATNAVRVLGKALGFTVLFLDILKGVLPVVFVAGLLSPDVNGRILSAVAAVCGHNWTCFLNFKGGKGVATSLGVLIGLSIVIPPLRIAVLLTVLGWLAVFLCTAYVSVASIVAGLLLPVLVVVFMAPFQVTFLAILFGIFVIFRHRPNIQRLMTGQEPQVPIPFHPASRK